MRRATTVGVVCERLEPRTLLTGVPLNVTQSSAFGQTDLRINSIAGNDRITLRQTPAGLVVGNAGGWTDNVSGTFERIIIHAGHGYDTVLVDPSVTTDCTIYGGPNRNVLQAGSGNDTLVTIGSNADTLIGGSGDDAFWLDNNARERILNVRPDEAAAGSVHRVGAFYNGAAPPTSARPAANARALRVRRLPQPLATPAATYQDYSNHPLFAAGGPSPNDTFQGQVGDCYLLATLSAVAKADPAAIRQDMLAMGDGTYLVQFDRGGNKVYVRVDGQLPTTAAGRPEYAGVGTGGSIWAAIMEKAYTVFHGPVPAYASIDGGWMTDAFAALGAAPNSVYSTSGATALLTDIGQELSGGRAVTYATNLAADGAPLLDLHAYSVDAVLDDAQGNPVGLRLRNPWGTDGAGNDGYITVTAAQAYDSMMGVVTAAV